MDRDNCCCYCDCCCEREEPNKEKKEACCKDGQLVLVFNTSIVGDVSITDSFRDNLRDNNESFNIKDNFREAVIVKDILSHNAIDVLSHNAIELLSRNCVDLMIDSARDFLNEAFKNALNESLNGINSTDNSTDVSDILNHNFSCNKDSFELPIANQVSKSSSCAKSEGGSTSTANNDADIITDDGIPLAIMLDEE